ncbi:uncharacterized protein LOC123549506 [Mercenaria mercenaria]|uniref:uncharacterized protein LOC123549506 n=1 Tax=Mercenaria mercenaria TaxID=6596 RepID=UPI00234F0CCF|nr:uncharacterized protein LOC123549506 [Mercenaria mercenaria]XP_045193582.2 uncharacterized protein LOC123549506 [Mercenaria mercenaria]
MEDVTETEKEIIAITAKIEVEKSEENFVNRSKLFYSAQLYRQALDDAKSALKINPKSIDGLVAAGKASLKLQNFLESYEFYKEGLALDPKNSEIAEDLRNLQTILLSDYENDRELSERSYNAVELCSQDVYPGDDELFKLEVEILAKKHKTDATKCIAPAQVDMKTRKDAATIAVMAYNALEDGRLQEALECIQVALRKDSTNARMIQIRAEIFRDLGEDEKALQDVMSIPKPHRVADVWKLGGKILAKLSLPILAEFWFRKATALIPQKEKSKDLEAPILFQKVRVKRIYGPLTIDFPVKVDFTNYGRAVYATDTLEPGEDAFDDLPVVVGQLLTCLDLPGCDHCGNSLITQRDYFGDQWKTLPSHLRAFVDQHWPEVTPLYCRFCRREKYCSATCQAEAWERYHQIICPSVNPVSTELYDIIDNKGQAKNERGVLQDVWAGHYSPIILIKIWASIIAEAKRQMKQAGLSQPSTENWAHAKMPFRKFISFGRESAVKRMPEIFKLVQRLFADCGDGVKYPISEEEFEARYFQATCNLQAFSSSITPKHKFMEKLPTIEDLRSLQILKFLEEKPPMVLFAGMFPLHACLNHACDNNVEVMDGFVEGKPAVHVRVKKHIKPGEELFTTYIDTSMPKRLRRAWLYKSFNFWCLCKRCQFEGDDNTSCTQCKKAAPEGKKFPGCSKCKKAWYCSTKCQKEAWVKGHKDICALLHSIVQMQAAEN